MLEPITAESKIFMMVKEIDGHFTKVPLKLNANTGNDIRVSINNSEDIFLLIDEISKVFRHKTLEYSKGWVFSTLLIEDVDYMDLTQAGSLKKLNNLLFTRDMTTSVFINGKLTNVGTVK